MAAIRPRYSADTVVARLQKLQTVGADAESEPSPVRRLVKPFKPTSLSGVLACNIGAT